MTETSRLENNFDFIRFLAAFGVLISHSYALTGYAGNDLMSTATRGLYSFSTLGVDTFFIISGYLIAMSAERSRSLGIFLWKRILRILPALIVVVILSVFLLGPLVTTVPLRAYFTDRNTYLYLVTASIYEMPWSLPGVFVGNPCPNNVNGSLWTLPYEFTLYVLLGFLVFLQPKKIESKTRKTVFIFFILGLLILRAYAELSSSTFYMDEYELGYIAINLYYLLHYTLLFGFGALLYFFGDRVPFNARIFSVCLAALAIAIFTSRIEIGKMIGYIVLPYSVIYLALRTSKLNGFGKYGDFSYGMYIYAFPVQQTIVFLYGGRTMPILLTVLLSFAVTMLFAVPSWQLIESKALRFKSRVA